MENDGVPSIFLSHNSNDKPFVRKLANRLSQAGVVIWLDEVNLTIGDSIIDKISEAIDNVEFVAAVISKASVNSPWVKKELNLAMTKEIAGKKKIILPILIDDCELPNALRDKLYADFRKHRSKKSFEEQCKRLLNAMGVLGSHQTRHAGGLTVDWSEGGPVVTGNGVVLSKAETNALTGRFYKFFDDFLEKMGTDYGLKGDAKYEGALLFAVHKACCETYDILPSEEEMKESKTEEARKIDLFFSFICALFAS
jgi:hypothetical protein